MHYHRDSELLSIWQHCSNAYGISDRFRWNKGSRNIKVRWFCQLNPLKISHREVQHLAASKNIDSQQKRLLCHWKFLSTFSKLKVDHFRIISWSVNHLARIWHWFLSILNSNQSVKISSIFACKNSISLVHDSKNYQRHVEKGPNSFASFGWYFEVTIVELRSFLSNRSDDCLFFLGDDASYSICYFISFLFAIISLRAFASLTLHPRLYGLNFRVLFRFLFICCRRRRELKRKKAHHLRLNIRNESNGWYDVGGFCSFGHIWFWTLPLKGIFLARRSAQFYHVKRTFYVMVYFTLVYLESPFLLFLFVYLKVNFMHLPRICIQNGMIFHAEWSCTRLVFVACFILLLFCMRVCVD